MKFVFALFVALVGMSAILSTSSVKADDVEEIIDPIFLEVGQRIDGDQLLDLYYAKSEETDAPTTHSVSITWEYNNINFIRVYAYADNAVYEHTGLPDNSGTITVTSQNVQHLTVTAYLYGLE